MLSKLSKFSELSNLFREPAADNSDPDACQQAAPNDGSDLVDNREQIPAAAAAAAAVTGNRGGWLWTDPTDPGNELKYQKLSELVNSNDRAKKHNINLYGVSNNAYV